MSNARTSSSEILIEDLILVYEWDKESSIWEIVNFYPNSDYYTLASDITKLECEEGYEEGELKLDLLYTIEGQDGSKLGDYFLNKDLKNDYTLIKFLDKLYSARDVEIKYSTDTKGVLTLTCLDFFDVFKKIIVPNNSFRNTTSNSGDVGYVGKIYYNEKDVQYIIKDIFKNSLFKKIKIPSPNQKIKLERDYKNQAEGFVSDITVDNYYKEIKTSIELEVQPIDNVISHINNKENLYMNFQSYIINGLIKFQVTEPKEYEMSIFDTFENTETSITYNKDFINNLITLAPDLKRYREVETVRFFLPLVQEEVNIHEEFSTEDDGMIATEEEELSKRDNSIVLNRLIVESVSSDVFLNVSVGDKVGKKHIISKKTTYENGTFDLDLAYDEQEDNIVGDIDIDSPDIDNTITSDSIWLYYNISNINSDLYIGQVLKPSTIIGDKSTSFHLQTQKINTDLESFRRNSSGDDSIGGTHNPTTDFSKTGYVSGTILSSYKSVDNEYGFNLRNPNLGILYESNQVLSPNKANSQIVSIGTDIEFGNYIMIKF